MAKKPEEEREREPRLRRRPLRIRLGAPLRPRREEFLGGRLEVSSARGVRGPEGVILESLDPPLAGSVLVAGGHDGLLAAAVARLAPEAEVLLQVLDAHDLRRGRESLALNGAAGARVRLAADLPREGGFDWVVLPVPKAGDARLAGELLREAHAALRPKGKLLAGTDNPRDRWLRDQVVEVFGAATIHRRCRRGTAYIARRQAGRGPRPRDYRRSFRAHVLGRDLELSTRPGVFSHGELDEGTRALSEVAVVGETTRVADLGCGSGALGIAAALAAPAGRALLVDSNARATQAARENCLRNGARNALVVLSHDFEGLKEGSIDLALANPPYYGDHRLTALFAGAAHRLLVAGGTLLLVTKAPERPLEIARALFGEAERLERRGYFVIRARRGERSG